MAICVDSELKKKKIDTHCHVWPMEQESEEISSNRLIEVGEMLGITEYWCSAPIMNDRFGSIEDVKRHNDTIIRTMRRHPDHIRGLCFVISGYFKKALDEVKRCHDEGMIGLKLYTQYKINDPAVWPVIEIAIEKRMHILVHASYSPTKQPPNYHRTSNALDFVDINKRYPEAKLVHAHIGGGGDWEWTVKALRDASSNVYVDVSGSNLDDTQIEFAVRQLGIERILFGTDGTMAGCVGKVLGSKLIEDEKDLIYWHNAANILAWHGKEPLYNI